MATALGGGAGGAVRPSPLDPEIFRIQVDMALAHFFAGHFDAAVAWAENAAGNLPSLLVAAAVAAASSALAGCAQDARQAMERLHELDPSMRIAKLEDWLPIHRPQDLARFAEGLRLAGLPECGGRYAAPNGRLRAGAAGNANC